MKWGNFLINKIVEKDGRFELEAEYLKDNNDFKNTKKLCWLDAKSPLVILIFYKINFKGFLTFS
jgi:hypothetical protein